MTSAHFAQKIGIGASSLHHIINGRNNPSLDVIQKILNSFPEINAEWLILGKGKPFKEIIQKTLFEDEENTQPNNVEQNMNTEKTYPESSFINEKLLLESKIQDQNTNTNQIFDSQEVEKIVILYKSGQFKIYKSL
ncbi:MAG: helix-turn-helix transcriptional regulator [Bacteroidales bacterium]|nr:helix-turn-helix transcriptional regulator [Bacteroidales bacterium]